MKGLIQGKTGEECESSCYFPQFLEHYVYEWGGQDVAGGQTQKAKNSLIIHIAVETRKNWSPPSWKEVAHI